jgi:hypothetical protein
LLFCPNPRWIYDVTEGDRRLALPRALRVAKIDVDVGRQRKATMNLFSGPDDKLPRSQKIADV